MHGGFAECFVQWSAGSTPAFGFQFFNLAAGDANPEQPQVMQHNKFGNILLVSHAKSCTANPLNESYRAYVTYDSSMLYS